MFNNVPKIWSVVSDTFNFFNDDGIFQLELRKCVKDPIPTKNEIKPNCTCADVWRLFLRCIEQDSSIDRWKYEITILQRGDIFDTASNDVLCTFVSNSEKAILNMCPKQIEHVTSTKIHCKLTLVQCENMNNLLSSPRRDNCMCAAAATHKTLNNSNDKSK